MVTSEDKFGAIWERRRRFLGVERKEMRWPIWTKWLERWRKGKKWPNASHGNTAMWSFWCSFFISSMAMGLWVVREIKIQDFWVAQWCEAEKELLSSSKEHYTERGMSHYSFVLWCPLFIFGIHPYSSNKLTRVKCIQVTYQTDKMNYWSEIITCISIISTYYNFFIIYY